MGEPIDLTGDGGVVKTILTHSDSTETPLNGHEVEVHYTGKLDSGAVFDSSYNRKTAFKFVLGEGNVIKGWDLGVSTMKVGEKAQFVIQPDYGYGKAGAGTSIPPNAVLNFEIELLNFRVKPKNKWEMSVDEKLQASMDLKLDGNNKFSSGNYTTAISTYLEGLDYLSESTDWADESAKVANTTKLHLCLNLANCYLKVSQFRDAEKYATDALKLDADNLKALFRRALARINYDLVEGAIEDLNALLKLDPTNADATNYLNLAKQKLAAYNQSDKKRYGTIFSKMSLYQEK